MATVILKAFNGDRKKNLESIAVEFRSLLNSNFSLLPNKEKRRYLGYCDQLDIIADEVGPLKGNNNVRQK